MREPDNSLDPVVIARREAAASGSVELADQGLEHVPDAVLSDEGLWSSVTAMNLRGNKLSTVPPALACFRRLERLHLDNNAVTAMHPALGGLPITEMTASRNRITSQGFNRYNALRFAQCGIACARPKAHLCWVRAGGWHQGAGARHDVH